MKQCLLKCQPKTAFSISKIISKKLPIPFVIYADFECFTIPMNSCQPNPNKSYTQSYQKHEPSGYALYLKGLDGMEINYKPIVYCRKSEDEDI